ncbi:MAG TPA: hypothetical protein VNH11_20995 [Pirellulales bacterium]|nr:hypothetical protein [Pirellulales bacterium]
MLVGKPMRLGQLVRMSVVLAAAVALSTSFDAKTAVASCGDYVMVGGHGHANHDHSMPGTPTCHGPNCHRQAPLPVPPTKGLPNMPPADAACWRQGDGPSRPPLCGRLIEERLSLADGHSLPLLRPPCL